MLTDKQHKCFNLAEEGKSIKEIAEEMDISYASARELYQRTYHTLDLAQENQLNSLVFSLSDNPTRLFLYLKRKNITTINELMTAKGLPNGLIEIREKIKKMIRDEMENDYRSITMAADDFIARAIDDHVQLEILKSKIKIYSDYYRKKCNKAREKNDAMLAEYEQICEIFRNMGEI